MYLVSACLLGLKTKYNGGDNLLERLLPYAEKGLLIPICPEQLGGLSTPRLPAEIAGPGDGYAFYNLQDSARGKVRVFNKAGEDITLAFVRGAQETLKLARLLQADGIILKQGSPSCGSKYIYDGSFTGRKIKGKGITASLLAKEGFPIYDENELPF